MARKRANTLPGKPPLVRIYAEAIEVLQREMGERAVADLFSNVRETGVTECINVVDDVDIIRFFERLGWLGGTAGDVRGKRAEEIVREIATEVDRTPAQASIVFRLYAAGLYGIFPDGICGNPPLCKRCSLTRHCAYYNAPPARSARAAAMGPVERLCRNGESSLSDDELLSLVIGNGRTTASSSRVAEELLSRYGSLRKIAQVSSKELESYASINRSMAVRLLAAFALSGRMSDEIRQMGPAVRSGKDFYDLYHKRLRDLRQEVFFVAMLDQRNRIVREEQISQGSLSAALVHPREVFAPAIRESAAAIALIHNHPSGDPTPSSEDVAITKRLGKTAQVVGIGLLDHVIVGEGSYTSFVDEGILQ